jgi:hypothetical protein
LLGEAVLERSEQYGERQPAAVVERDRERSLGAHHGVVAGERELDASRLACAGSRDRDLVAVVVHLVAFRRLRSDD